MYYLSEDLEKIQLLISVGLNWKVWKCQLFWNSRIYLILRFRCYTSCDTTYHHKRFCLLIKCCMHEYICVLCSITFLYCHWTHNHSVLSALFLEKFLLWTFLKKSWHFHTFQCKLSQTTEIGCALTQNRYAGAAGRKITLNCMYLLNVSVVAAGIQCLQFCSIKCLDMAFFGNYILSLFFTLKQQFPFGSKHIQFLCVREPELESIWKWTLL